MNVSLSPDLESFVRENVANGRYTTASEVVRDALRLLQQKNSSRAELDELLAKAKLREFKKEVAGAMFAKETDHPIFRGRKRRTVALKGKN